MPADAWGANRRRAGEDSTVLPLPPLGSGSSGPSSNGALRGVSSAISYAHEGSAQAVAEVLSGRGAATMARAFHAQPAPVHPEERPRPCPSPPTSRRRCTRSPRSSLRASPRHRAIAGRLGRTPGAPELRQGASAEADLRNPLEPLHKEIRAAHLRRRHLPHPRIAHADGRDAAVRARPEWQVADRCYFSAGSMARVDVVDGR